MENKRLSTFNSIFDQVLTTNSIDTDVCVKNDAFYIIIKLVVDCLAFYNILHFSNGSNKKLSFPNCLLFIM